MKDNRLKGIIALAVVTVVAFVLIYGSKAFVNNKEEETVEGAIDVEGHEGIKAAREITDDTDNITGYLVTAARRGYAGEITLDLTFDKDGEMITDMVIVSHNETEGYGKKMEEGDYLDKFVGIELPVHLTGEEGDGTEVDAISGATKTSQGLVNAANIAYDFISNYVTGK